MKQITIPQLPEVITRPEMGATIAEAWLPAVTQEMYEGGDTPTSEDITDLLTDIMHWCKKNDVDFDDCLAAAQEHYEEEVGLHDQGKTRRSTVNRSIRISQNGLS